MGKLAGVTPFILGKLVDACQLSSEGFDAEFTNFPSGIHLKRNDASGPKCAEDFTQGERDNATEISSELRVNPWTFPLPWIDSLMHAGSVISIVNLTKLLRTCEKFPNFSGTFLIPDFSSMGRTLVGL